MQEAEEEERRLWEELVEDSWEVPLTQVRGHGVQSRAEERGRGLRAVPSAVAAGGATHSRYEEEWYANEDRGTRWPRLR